VIEQSPELRNALQRSPVAATVTEDSKRVMETSSGWEFGFASIIEKMPALRVFR